MRKNYRDLLMTTYGRLVPVELKLRDSSESLTDLVNDMEKWLEEEQTVKEG